MAKLRYFIFIISVASIFSINSYAVKAPSHPPEFDIENIQKLTGKVGQFDPNKKTYEISVPHDDLSIVMSGMQITSSRGLSSHIYFKKVDDQTLVNGDLILLQDQVNPVMSIALENKLQVVSLNNFYLWDSPRIMVMRIKGEGNPLQLASAIGAVIKKINTTANGAGDFPFGDFYFPNTTLDTHKIDRLLGVKGQLKNDIYQVKFNCDATKADAETNKIMAENTWAAFAGSDNEAVVNGSMLVHQSELQKVLMTLRHAEIYIFTIYQYAMDDDSSLVSIHFWGIGNIDTLAKALRSTFLIAQDTKKEEVLVGSNTMNLLKEAEIMPVQVSLYQDRFCHYAVMSQTSVSFANESIAAALPKENIIQTRSAGLASNIILPQKILVLSAKAMLSKLSVVKNNKLVITLLPRKIIYPINENNVAAVRVSSIVVKPKQEIFAPSARAILSRFSVVKNNQPAVILLSNPIKKSFLIFTKATPTMLISNTRVSAKAILWKLSVVKNNQLTMTLSPHHS